VFPGDLPRQDHPLPKALDDAAAARLLRAAQADHRMLVPPTFRPAQDREIRRMHDNGDYNVAEIAALFGISRPTVYRSLERTTALPPLPA
jgi:DNA-directed RNA polymerase specialized sigma24 family protein